MSSAAKIVEAPMMRMALVDKRPDSLKGNLSYIFTEQERVTILVTSEEPSYLADLFISFRSPGMANLKRDTTCGFDVRCSLCGSHLRSKLQDALIWRNMESICKRPYHSRLSHI